MFFVILMEKAKKLEILAKSFVDDTLNSSEEHKAIVVQGDSEEIPQIIELMKIYVDKKREEIEIKRNGFGYSIDADHYINNLNI